MDRCESRPRLLKELGENAKAGAVRPQRFCLWFGHANFQHTTFSTRSMEICTLEVQPTYFISWFPNHHYFTRGLSLSKRNHHFLKCWRWVWDLAHLLVALNRIWNTICFHVCHWLSDLRLMSHMMLWESETQWNTNSLDSHGVIDTHFNSE